MQQKTILIMKPCYLLLLALFLSLVTFQSCSEEGEGEGDVTQLQNPGDVVKGAVGCSASQKDAIEGIPGMGDIATTTLGEDGSYIYADASGNTCTLDAEGNIKMESTDGSTVTRDNTISQSSNSVVTVLSGKIMVGTNEEPENDAYVGVRGLLEMLVEDFPESRQVIEVKTQTIPKNVVREADYDSIRISFQNEICMYEVIAKHKTATHTYTLIETEYIAHDGYFDADKGRFHMIVNEEGMARLYQMEERYNEETETMEWVDAYPISNYCVASYSTNLIKDYKITNVYSSKPSRSEYFNYRLTETGNAVLTNKTKAVFLEKETNRWYEDESTKVKYEVISSDGSPEEGGEDGDNEDDEVLILPPAPNHG